VEGFPEFRQIAQRAVESQLCRRVLIDRQQPLDLVGTVLGAIALRNARKAPDLSV
jgi:hypothetical protein